jgi:hypothetical protein
MLVAVIDCGVNSSYFSIGKLKYDMFVTRFNRVHHCNSNVLPISIHGTVIAGIIRKYAPQVEFCSINIFPNQSMKTTSKHLITALKWCYSMEIPLINMSVGSITQSDFKNISRIINKLCDNGQTIVAAANNNGRYTLPAMHSKVIGVASDLALNGYSYLKLQSNRELNYIASSRHTLLLPTQQVFETRGSNSAAAPTITAAVANGDIKV